MQVKFKIRQSCSPLPESVFKEAISDNYFAEVKFTFELTISQKDHLVSLFTKNMQGPAKSISSSNTVSYQAKAGASVKGWKKADESEPGDAWGKPKTFNPAIGNAWQKVDHTGKGTSDDVKSISFNHGKAKQEASGNSSENLFNALKQQGSDDNSVYPEVDRQSEADFPAFGATTGTQSQTSDVKNNEAAGNVVYSNDRQELDKAEKKRQILEKLQRIAPARAEAQQEQQSSMVLEKFQGLDISSVVDSQQKDSTSMQPGGFQYNPQNETVDSTGGMVVALTPMRFPAAADWERQAKDRAAMEQAVLREDRERLWVTTSAVDMNIATAFKRSLEVSANTIAQVEPVILTFKIFNIFKILITIVQKCRASFLLSIGTFFFPSLKFPKLFLSTRKRPLLAIWAHVETQ